MIFGTSKANIIYITKDKLQAFYVSGRKNPKPDLKKIMDWTPETLTAGLTELKKSCDSPVRILLGDELSLVVGISVSKNFSDDRESVRRKAEELIPEDLSKVVWDFKQLLLTKNAKTGEEMVALQVIALPESFSAIFIEAINKSGLAVEAIEPISTSLAHELTDENVPVWVIYSGATTTIFFANRGLVLFSRSFDREITPKDLIQLNSYAEEKLGIKPTKIIIAGAGSENYLATLSLENTKVEKYSIDPLASFSRKDDIYGTDKFILNLSESIRIMNKESKHEQSESEEVMEKLKAEQKELIESYGMLGADQLIKNLKDEAKKDRWRLRITMATFFISFLTTVISFWILYQRQVENQIIENLRESSNLVIWENIRGTQSASSTEIINEMASSTVEIPITKLIVNVLNGSGRSGEAKKVSSILTAKGYSVLKTGNADNNNYETTQLKFSQKVSESTRADVETLLGSSYNIEVAQTLLEESEKVDILIIIGKT